MTFLGGAQAWHIYHDRTEVMSLAGRYPRHNLLGGGGGGDGGGGDSKNRLH